MRISPPARDEGAVPATDRFRLHEQTAPPVMRKDPGPTWPGTFDRLDGNEWAYSRTWTDSSTRARSLLSFIRYYNRQRPHSSLGDRPPISRIHKICGQDN
jgi:transposase InsO family protein